MAVPFIIDYTKRHSVSQITWGNRYLVLATDLTEAISALDALTPLEVAVHQATVEILQARVATLAANDGLYVSVPLSEVGSVGETGPEMPAITTINVEMLAAGFGRPSRKYYHGFYGTSAMHLTVAQRWSDARVTAVRDAMLTAIGALQDNATPMCDPDEQLITEAVIVQRLFGFHQFHKQSPRTPPA